MSSRYAHADLPAGVYRLKQGGKWEDTHPVGNIFRNLIERVGDYSGKQ